MNYKGKLPEVGLYELKPCDKCPRASCAEAEHNAICPFERNLVKLELEYYNDNESKTSN